MYTCISQELRQRLTGLLGLWNIREQIWIREENNNQVKITENKNPKLLFFSKFQSKH